MIRVAVIGAIGSGKSHIAKKFSWPVFNADAEVSKLYKKNRKCYNKLKRILPNYINTFPVKKNNLSKAIMKSKKNLIKITKIVHPEIRSKLKYFIKKNKKKDFVVLDIPLFIENKMNKKNDILVFVDAKKKEINKRLRKRKNFNVKLVNKFKKIQLSLEKKRKLSNFIIKNNFTNNYVKKDVKRVKKEIFLNA